MVSAIDETKPEDNELALKSDLRANLAAAKAEIEALQTEIASALQALGLLSGETDFPILGGDNTPGTRENLIVNLLALDAAITAAAQGGGGGPLTLADITDLNSPSQATRRAFQAPLPISPPINASFAFDENVHGGALVPFDPTSADVAMTLPAPASLSRPDGYLCSITTISQANLVSVIGPTDTLRYQTGLFGLDEIVTEVFLGLSQDSSFRAILDIFKVGGVYQIRGPAREVSGSDFSTNTAQSVPGTALVDDSLPAAAFPTLLDIGGSKRAGGAREIQEDIAGNHAFLQANAGKTIVHTGGAAASWDVPTLAAGTRIEVENEGGEITFNVLDSQTTRGGLTLPANASGAVRWLTTGRVVFLGTVA